MTTTTRSKVGTTINIQGKYFASDTLIVHPSIQDSKYSTILHAIRYIFVHLHDVLLQQQHQPSAHNGALIYMIMVWISFQVLLNKKRMSYESDLHVVDDTSMQPILMLTYYLDGFSSKKSFPGVFVWLQHPFRIWNVQWQHSCKRVSWKSD